MSIKRKLCFSVAILAALFVAGCSDEQLVSFDPFRPFGYDVGGSAELAIKNCGLEERRKEHGDYDVVVYGGNFMMPSAIGEMRMNRVMVDWKHGRLLRVSAEYKDLYRTFYSEAEVRAYHKVMRKSIARILKRKPDRQTSDKRIYNATVKEESVWTSTQNGRKVECALWLVQGEKSWNVVLLVEDRGPSD